MPQSSGTTGTFTIRTYNDQDNTNIYTNGDVIDSIINVAGLSIGSNSRLSTFSFFDFITEHVELRAGAVGPFSLSFKSSTTISQDVGLIRIDLTKTALEGGAVGF